MPMRYDNVIYRLRGGKMVQVGEPKAPHGEGFTNEERENFLIVCDYGDWSPFLALKSCLLRLERELAARSRDDGFFEIVERL